jgi:hypothetical protein
MSDMEKMARVASRAAASRAGGDDGDDRAFVHELRSLLDEYLADLREDCLLDQLA